MKILYIILCLLFVGCGSGSDSSSENNYYSQDSTTDVIIVEDPEPGPVALSLLSGNDLYFYNGEFQLQENISPKPCGIRCFTDGNIKKIYGDYGDVESSEFIALTPDFIVDDWILEVIDPQTAYSLGAQARFYTRVYFQGVEVDFWFLNQWLAVDLIKVDSEVIAIDENNGYHVLTSEISSINHAKDLLIYDFDSINKRALINGNLVTWSMNYFNQADQWQKSGDTWYSWNGYEYNGTLAESANAMHGWNTGVYPVVTQESPVLLSAGTRLENSETVLYFIECNTGWMIKYVPSIDSLTAVYRLYFGDGLRMTGVANKSSLKPALIDGYLYFYESGSVWKLNIDSGIVQLFFAGNGEVKGW